MTCPLCASDRFQKSAFSCSYQESEFRYVECLGCESLYCNPMPEPQMLQQMYGPRYETASSDAPSDNVEDPKEPGKCVEWLRSRGVGTFLDYGCGTGLLLE